MSTTPAPVRAGATNPDDSCVRCHSNADFLVTNKKLYDYFQQWSSSTHQQEGVACTDCHGGNPNAPDKKSAHGSGVDEENAASAINLNPSKKKPYLGWAGRQDGGVPAQTVLARRQKTVC